MDEKEFRNRYGSSSESVKRLVKRPKRVNSSDVEAMLIADAHSRLTKVLFLFRGLILSCHIDFDVCSVKGKV